MVRRSKLTRRTNPSVRLPVRRARPRISFNGQMLKNNYFPPNMATVGTTGANLQIFGADCGLTYLGGSAFPISSVSSSSANITSLYKEYTMISLQAQWFPGVGPNSPGANTHIYIGHETNPEHIVALSFGTIASGLSRLKADRTVKFFSAWERMSFTFQIPLRRRKYDVNSSLDISDPNVINRSMQGLIVTGCDGGPNTATDLGGWVFTPTLSLEGLSNINT